MTRRKERRAHPRISTSLPIQVGAPEGGVLARMVANNLSLGGLYCTSTADFPEMTRLAVRLLLPSRNGARGEVPLDIEAVVVRREAKPSASGEPRFELGLFFTSLDDAAREHIRRFLS